MSTYKYKMKYIIKSAPRSGKHKVMGYFETNYQPLQILSDTPYDTDRIPELGERILVLSHHGKQSWLPENPKEWILIRIFRNDLFNQVCSEMIAARHTYTYNKRHEVELPRPFIGRKAEFDELCRYFINLNKKIANIDGSVYKKDILLASEEVFTNRFTDKLPFKGNTDLIQFAPTPYKKSHVISNYYILKQHFLQKWARLPFGYIC